MPTYLSLPGVKGAVTATGYVGWIEVGDILWGSGRIIVPPDNKGLNRERGSIEFEEMMMSMAWSSASGKMWDAYNKNLAFSGSTKLMVLRTGDASQLYQVLLIKLQDVLISDFESKGTDNSIVERFTLAYTKIEFSDYIAPEVNQTGVPAVFGYDLSTPGPL